MARWGRGLAWLVGAAAALGVVAHATVLDAFTVPDDPALGASTAPTLASGDVLLVMKHASGGFGDLVVCPDPSDPARTVIGRIAGVAGDHVVTQGRSLEVNHRQYEGEMACPTPRIPVTTARGATVEIACDEVTMGGGWHYRGSLPEAAQPAPTARDVPAGRVFLLSDDRDLHDDSRDFGPVPVESCRRILSRLWGRGGPSDPAGRFNVIR
ncbi:MAG TPA: signal peptidase I [Minicystis sp.]|nr:signal peptidase I [Minicystis sp.]